MRSVLRPALAIIAILTLTWLSPACATDLGQALNFGVLSTGGSVTFGTDAALGGGGTSGTANVGATGITLRRDVSVVGDLIASPNGINMKTGSGAINCVTAGAKVVQADGSNCLSVDTTNNNTEVTTLLPQAITDIANFVSAAQSQPVTQQIPSKIVVAANDGQTITDTQAGLNIITAPSITLKKDSSLILQGFTDQTDSVVLIVAGNLKVGSGADLAPSNFAPSFSEANLVIIVLGRTVSVGRDALLNGTVVAPNARCTLAADFATRGAYICGKSITLANQSASGSGSIAFTPATGVSLP